MDIHQNLYKNIKVPKSLTKRRDIQKENRLNRRQKDFQQRRNISLSPETSQSNIQQKNIDPETIGLAVPNDSALRRQREYLARLRGWKKQKMEANKENIYKTKPFIPAGSGTSTNVLCQNSKQKPIKSDVVKNRQSIYALRKTTAGVSCSNGNQPKSEIPTTNKSTSKNVTRLEGPSTSVTKNMKKAPDHNKLKAKIEQPAKKQEDNTMKNQFKKNMHTLPAKLIPKAQLVEQKSVVTQNKPNLKRITTKEGTNKSVKSKLGTTMKAKKETINQKSINQKSNLSKISKAQLNCIANEVMGTSTGTKQNSYEICVTSNRFKRSKNNITCSNNNKSIQNGPRQKQVEQKGKFIRYSLAFSEENENKNAFNKSNKENDSDKLTIKNSRGGVVMENKSTPKKSITENRKNECTSTDSNPIANNLDGVRFYRQQLQKETERLQNLCETWELYEQDNQTFLEERSGDDMIHATLGQTRLFINKKFKQFSQLIDRCEKNIHNSIEGSGSSVPLDDDGSESTKPITLRDLDGFWHSMIELQLADLEKRFKNLNRWKANDWKDPDEVVQSERPTVKNAGKVSKGNIMKNSNRTKVSTSSSTAAAFIAMMRKAQVEKLQQEQQKQHNEDDADVIVTSYNSNKRNNPSSFTVTSSTQFQQQQLPVQKLNFIRYSLAKEDENTKNNDVENEKVNELFQNSDKDNDSDTPILRNNEKETPLDDKSTPVKNDVTQPLTYLSPSVTVARGKVTPETEERERQRIITDINSMTINLDGVRFYRQQLQTKNERLQNLCETWELYKQHNQTFLEEIGDDMIHATLSQTRLFINKKLKQFSKLIDHCEKNIYNSIEGSNSSVPLDDNGGKNTKPVKLRDLEDFWWSMIKSKLDDLEKRFENLNLWKANNWKDPDEVVQSERPTVKSAGRARKGNKMKNSSRMKVSTSSSTAAAFIAQVRKNRTQKQCDDDGCDVTPSQDNARKDSRFTITPLSSSKQQQWPRIRHSAVVRDRKYMSPTATRLSLRGPKPSPRPPSFLLKPAFLQQDLNLNLSSAIQKLNKSLETLNAAANNSSGKDKGSPKKKELVRTPPAELPSAHKSILKTPGTAKSKLKNVSFDCKLRVKPHKFIFTDEGDSVSSASTYEEDMENSNNTQEVQSLSNEKELARPSHDNT